MEFLSASPLETKPLVLPHYNQEKGSQGRSVIFFQLPLSTPHPLFSLHPIITFSSTASMELVGNLTGLVTTPHEGPDWGTRESMGKVRCVLLILLI